MPVDADLDQSVGRLWRQQEMIDPDPIVLLPGAGLLVPERVEPRRIGRGPHRIRQA
jgi:hypothetical protein